MDLLKQKGMPNPNQFCFLRPDKLLQYFFVILIYCGIAPAHSVAQVAKVNAKTVLPIVSEDVYQSIIQFYEYDRNIPLEARILEKEELQEGNREKIVFVGINHSRVPSYLVIPNSEADMHPIILIVDGIYGSKERWFEDDSWPKGGLIMKAFLNAGFAVMILDAVYHGERSAENEYAQPPWPFQYPHAARHMVIQTAIEYRRAIDYLSNRNDIDTTKIGMLGLSMGGLITFELTSIDPRIRTAVAGLTPLLRKSELQSSEPSTFAGHVRCNSFLMFVGNKDRLYSMEEAHQLFDMIPITQKKFVEYDTGHKPPVEYVKMVTEWFTKNLK